MAVLDAIDLLAIIFIVICFYAAVGVQLFGHVRVRAFVDFFVSLI